MINIYNPLNDKKPPTPCLGNVGLVFSRLLFVFWGLYRLQETLRKLRQWWSPGKTSCNIVSLRIVPMQREQCMCHLSAVPMQREQCMCHLSAVLALFLISAAKTFRRSLRSNWSLLIMKDSTAFHFLCKQKPLLPQCNTFSEFHFADYMKWLLP